jgi:hypothetical protein
MKVQSIVNLMSVEGYGWPEHKHKGNSAKTFWCGVAIANIIHISWPVSIVKHVYGGKTGQSFHAFDLGS